MASRKGPAFRENIHRLFDEAQATDLGPGIVSLIESRATRAQISEIPSPTVRFACGSMSTHRTR